MSLLLHPYGRCQRKLIQWFFSFESVVFTPLFLGAQLHIPTAEDIGTPGRLAEWMADSQITVTHLTPGTAEAQFHPV